MEPYDAYVNQGLEGILENVIAPGRVIYHPLEYAIAGMIGSSHLLRASSCWEQLVMLIEQVEECAVMFFLEGVMCERTCP